MDSELNLLINNIKDKTGIDVVVFSSDMKYFASTSKKEIYTPTDMGFSGVYQDILTGNTYFRAKYKNSSLIGYVFGIGTAEKNYAHLLTDLIESAPLKELQLSQAEYLKSIILGECDRVQIQKYEKDFSVASKSCSILLIATAGGRKQDVLTLLNVYDFSNGSQAVALDDNLFAFVKFSDGALDDYQSTADFANFLVQSIKEETGLSVKIGVGGTVKNFYEINASYLQALMAIRMCNVMDSKGAVHSFKEYLLVKMFEDLPKYKLNEYLSTLLDDSAEEIFNDSEMTNTAEEFLDSSLNISETSRKLYLHRNTLMYRLDKIERETGLNIRKFSDAVTFRLITVLLKLTK